MGPGMFDGLDALFRLMAWALVLSVPLALWKLGELVWWVVTHVKVTW